MPASIIPDFIDYEDSEAEHTCPGCFSPCYIHLGTLGRTEHFRCRDCGAEWAETQQTARSVHGDLLVGA